MSNLDNAVAKTMNFVFADIDESKDSKKKRIASLKANLGKIANIDLDEFTTDENVRQSLDTSSQSFLSLVESIKKYGILENIVAELRLNEDETDYELVCVAGHRRIFAAKEAKTITKIPCLLKTFNKKGDKIGAALAENLNREDLHCIDIADGYQGLIDSGWKEEEIGNYFCRDIRTVRHYLKVASWSKEIKDLLRSNPEKFSTRVIMRQIAYKKCGDDKQLKQYIKNILNPQQSQSKPAVKKKIEATHDKKACLLGLEKYLHEQKFLSSLIKDEIKKAFLKLNLI